MTSEFIVALFALVFASAALVLAIMSMITCQWLMRGQGALGVVTPGWHPPVDGLYRPTLLPPNPVGADKPEHVHEFKVVSADVHDDMTVFNWACDCGERSVHVVASDSIAELVAETGCTPDEAKEHLLKACGDMRTAMRSVLLSCELPPTQ